MEIQKKAPLSRRDKILRKIIDYGILALVIFSPLPAASVNEWSVLVIELAVLVMMAAYFLMKEKPSIHEDLILSMKWIRRALVGFSIFLAIQMIPLPGFLVKIVSPQAHAFWQFFSPAGGGSQWMTLSLAPGRTFERSLELLSYGLLGFLVLRTVKRQFQIRRIILTAMGIGIFEAFYGLFELYNKNPRILFYKKIYNLDSVTGTFVNRNHLSGYLEMIIPLVIGLMIARIGLFSLSGLRWREKVLRFSEKGLTANIFISLGILIMAVALVFSRSRAGVFILFLIFILFLGLTTVSYGKASEQKKWISNFLRVVFIVILIVVLYVGIQATMERFALDKILQEGRPALWTNTLKIISDFPLVGTGLGSFSSLYPDLSGETGPLRLSHTHNDYLEYLSEIGIVGVLFLLGAILMLFIRIMVVWYGRRHPEAKALALGGIIAIFAILIHSITDFNLHIPANTLLFTVVLSLTMVTVFYRRTERKKP